MIRLSRRFFSAACIVFGAVLPAAAQVPQPPEIAARSYLLIDMTARQVLAEREADAPADPASLTKLMTAYLVFNALARQQLTLEQRLAVSERAWAERTGGGSLMFIDPRMRPTVDELLKGMIVQSGNDAAVALAEAVAGSLDKFVAMMNRQAQAWELRNTAFKNVTGLTEPGHHSTARELAEIAQHIIRDHPERYATYYSMKDYTFNGIRQDNRNLLLWRDPAVDGMKTGFTAAAGYCLIASSRRALPNGQRRLLSVVLGTASTQARANESQKLLNWGATAFDDIRLFDADTPVATAAVWKGAQNSVGLVGEGGPIYVAVPKGEGQNLRTVVERLEPLIAPINRGQRVGALLVSSPGGEKIASIPLLAQHDVPLGNVLTRAWDAVRLWIK